MEAFVIQYITEFTYLGIFAFLMLTVFGFPFPEDAVLLLSGALASQGVTKVMPTMYIAYFGVITGDLILYYIGRRFGRKIVYHKRFGRVLTEARLKRAKVWFSKWGDPLVFFGRHFVGFRAQIFLCAGVLKHSAKRVMFYDSLSAFIGVPVMVGLGYLFGHNLPAIRRYVENTHWALTGAALLVVAAGAVYFAYRKRKQARRGQGVRASQGGRR